MTDKDNAASHLQTARLQLTDMIEQLVKNGRHYETNIPGLSLHRWEHPTEPVSYMHDPSICVILQGKKRVLLGEENYYYQTNQFLVSSLDLPIIANIVEATKDKPYIGITYRLNQKEIANLLVNSNIPGRIGKSDSKSMGVGDMSLSLYYSFLRLISLMDEPENIEMIAPMIHKEILFRLLTSDQGPRLRDIGMAGSKESQIAKAIGWLKSNYNTQLKIEALASHVRMSTSSLYLHFREMTNMSPLQYQKWIRLHEARRLMLTEKIDASNAAFEVGYESPSQFSREYKRLFGNPPLKDIKLMTASQ
ncbi:MAG: AraC family transcriptional regulator [Deferribacterales bacterium]